MDRDIQRLRDALLSGDISLDHAGTAFSEFLDERKAHHLARDIMGWIVDNEAFTLMNKILGSKEWLDVTEAYLYIGVDFKTLKALAVNGDIIGKKLGKSRTAPWRFNRPSIDEYLRQGTIEMIAREKARDMIGGAQKRGFDL